MQKSKMQNSKLKIKTFLVVIILFFIPVPVFSAEIFFDSRHQIQVGEEFEVKLLINSEQESINAFEGKIIYPKDVLDFKEIRDGNSIVNFWIERPRIHNDTIIFSGITPGGFDGENGFIFSVIFEGKKESVAEFEIKDTRVLRNDGIGSKSTLTTMPYKILISSQISDKVSTTLKVKDRERPELFVPEITNNKNLFDGKWFAVFATQDKGSGISHYKVKESRQRILSVFKKWVSVESPYLLADQELQSYVWIKAVDKAGNKRIVKINPQNPLVWYENYDKWIIIIIGLFIIMFSIRRIWRKKNT